VRRFLLVLLFGMVVGPASASGRVAVLVPTRLPSEARDQLAPLAEVETAILEGRLWKAGGEESLRLDRARKTLVEQARRHPEVAELWLELALAHHYAAALGDGSAAQESLRACERAEELAPGDYRAAWFAGVEDVRLGQVALGATKIWAQADPDRTADRPVAFWEDAARAAIASAMPSKARMALALAGPVPVGPRGRLRRSVQEQVDVLLKKTDRSTKIPGPEVWALGAGADRGAVRLTSTLLGVSVECSREWKATLGAFADGKSTLSLDGTPLTQGARRVVPRLGVLVQTPSPGLSLEGFARGYFLASGLEATADVAPVSAPPLSLALRGRLRDAKAGDATHVVVAVAFAREEPFYPGILFESPLQPPDRENPRDRYLPAARWDRFGGPLYYLVALETPENLLGSARADLDRLLAGLLVD